ncbi:MAG: hypothetical protein N838_28890 [Thiohalocapsa sp. PB-PSB1]|jgi:hypothetical protein|nr:MAG: hypothetical protein N838_28890 [Thiohalocapsa sp. PB-PSB1]
MLAASDRRGIQSALFCLLALLCAGCTGWAPFEPRDEREEGPKAGLFSGEAGEFVIYRRDGAAPD